MGLSAGKKLGHYEIRSLIGSGGMGEVYLAQDSKLERKVALKVLPAELAANSDRMHRFVQEAKSASSLNHPHIITIYEIDESSDPPYIATEFIDGETLRKRMSQGPLRLRDALEIVIQVASALASAHAAGIVHRDIKPENIMLRQDGYAKVLDFGLAKLSQVEVSAVDSEAATRNFVKTDPGAVMGTVWYMSPEQARGLPVDARTDIWSLGVVLYEMVAGRVPFDGQTATDAILAIVDKEPASLTRHVPAAPEALEWIVTKALTKDKDERYQTAREMATDLRRLKQKLDTDIEIERSSVPRMTGEPIAVTRSDAGNTREAATVTTVSSAEYLIGQISSNKKKAGAFFGVAVVVLAGLSYAGYRFLGRPATDTGGKPAKLSLLTTDGVAGAVNISPDGKWVVHSSGNNAARSLWVRQVTTNSSIQIVPPAAGRFIGTAFTPEGDHIYYTWQGQGEASGRLFEIPSLGGTPRQLLDKVDGPVSFDPEGKRFVFVRETSELLMANIDGSDLRSISKVDKVTEWLSDNGPSWSPDGRLIALGIGSSDGGLRMTVATVPAEGGPATAITDQKWTGEVARVVWLSDGSGLIANASNNSLGGTQIWFVPYPKGAARRITNDLNGYGTFSLGVSKDNTTIASVQENTSQQIWTASAGDDEGKATQVNTGKYDAINFSWSPDGHIVFVRLTGDATDIWIMNSDGSQQKQLTKDAASEDNIQISQDGRFIVYVSDRSGLPHVWRMNIDGTEPKQLTTGDGFDDANPHISPDGKWVIYNSWKSGNFAPWKVGIDGGEPQLLFSGRAPAVSVTADGNFVYCRVLDEQSKPPRRRMALVALDGSQTVKFVDGQLPQEFGSDGPQVVSGNNFYFVRDNNVWSVPLIGGNAKQVTNFKTRSLFGIAVSADGKRFALARGEVTDDVVLMRDFR